MKRRWSVAIVLLCLAALLSGCSRDMNWVVDHEPCVRGIVEEIGEDYVLIRVTEADELEGAAGGLVRADKATRLQDCVFSAQVGDEVAVYYDSGSAVTPGGIPEIHEVHGYTLITSAGRSDG